MNHRHSGVAIPVLVLGVVLATAPTPGQSPTAWSIALDHTVQQLRVADLDRDGISDVVTAGDESSVLLRVFRGRPDGTLDAPVVVGAGIGALSGLEAGDMNGDGRADLVAACLAGSGCFLSVCPQQPDGSFGFPIYSTVPITAPAAGMRVADVDGDGDLDVIHLAATGIGGAGGIHALVFTNDGTAVLTYQGQYSAMPPGPTGVTSSEARDLLVRDVNGDGDLDLVVLLGVVTWVSPTFPFLGSAEANTVCVLENDGAGAFPSISSFATSSSPRRLVAGDLTQDGELDVAVSCWGTTTTDVGSLDVLSLSEMTDGDGGTSLETGAHPSLMVAADFDGDIDLDLVIATTASPTETVSTQLSTFMNDGGALVSSVTLPFPITQLGAGDFTRDGSAELVFVSFGALTLVYGPGRTTPLMPGSSDSLALTTLVDGQPGTSPAGDRAVAPPGSTVSVSLTNPGGEYVTTTATITGFASELPFMPNTFQGIHNLYVPPWFDTWFFVEGPFAWLTGALAFTFTVPPGVPAGHVVVQGLITTEFTPESGFVTSDAHVIVVP